MERIVEVPVPMPPEPSVRQAVLGFKERIEAMQKAAKKAAMDPASTGMPKSEKDGMIDHDTLSKRGIFKRFWNVTAAGLDNNCPAAQRPQWQLVRKYIQHLGSNLSHGKGLMLIGPVGTLKTTMAVAVLRELVEQNPQQGYFIPMVSLLDQLNEERDSRSHKLEDRIRNTRLLILDDLGAEYDHLWVQCKVDAIITERYNRMKSTIVTSNLTREEIRDRYQLRIFDRLRATSQLITFSGKSQRPTAR